jgi:hypothetical protein
MIPSSTDVQTLNPTLYRRLKAKFGRVKISHRGGKAIKYQNPSNPRNVHYRHGEYYCVNCPTCHDKRYRLWISYLYGTDDDNGRPLTHLAVCYNEGCNQDYLWEWLSSGLSPSTNTAVAPDTELTENTINLKPVALPDGQHVLLDQLPSDHPALKYVIQRGFSPELLAREYLISYTVRSHERYFHQRLLLPVFDMVDGKVELVGYQSRAIPGVTHLQRPKYYTMSGFTKSATLFNFTRASAYDIIIICEGVFDALRMHPCGVCVFGKSISMTQVLRLGQEAPNAKLVVLLDGAASKETQDMVNMLASRSNQNMPFGCGNLIVPVKVPDEGKDPADYPADFLWSLIHTEIERASK